MRENTYSLNRTLGLAIATIAVVALVGSGVVLVTLSRWQAATVERSRSVEIILGLDAFRTAMLNQETAIRGYLLTGDGESLEPYRPSVAAFDTAVGQLRALIGRDSQQLGLLEEAIAAARSWQEQVGATVIRDMAVASTQDRARLIEATGAGRELFDAFRSRLAPIEAHERNSLAEQSRVVDRAGLLAKIALWTSLIITVLICFGAGQAITRLITRPLGLLAETMRRLVGRDTAVTVPALSQRNEVGAMARAVQVFKDSLIQLDRTSVLRVTADTMPAMVGYIDSARCLGFLNEEFARRFALGSEDVAQVSGRPLEQVFPKGTFPGSGPELEAALAGEEVRFAFQREEGAVRRDYEGYFRPHRGPHGTLLGVVALFTDVTDRREIDRRLRHQAHDLRRSNEELEQFAYVASHDLKAPLRGIENLATWIEEDLGDKLEGDTRTNMGLLRSRVRRLESLLTDLLAYSRAGRGENVVREVDTRALVEELAVLVSPPEGFRITAAPDLPTLRAAQAALSQVLQNLIGNAIKHHPNPSEGLVKVEARREGAMYEFRVSDNGSGIPSQFRERVFGMFQTLRPRDEVEGSGMGLAIVRKLVERQGGKVWLGERPEGGLVAHFTWPAVPEER